MYESYLNHVKKHWEKQTSINRIDNNSNYCKNNCEWATSKIQSLNTSRNLIIEKDWVKKTAKEWADELWINENTIRVRFMRWQETLHQWKIYKKNSLMKEYKKHKEFMWNNCVSYHTFRQRINRQWMDIQKAIYKGKK